MMNMLQHATAIRTAIRRTREDDAHVLSLIGNDIEEADSSGRTPIFHAVIAGRISLLEKLIEIGASPTHQDTEKRAPLHFAVLERSIPAAKMLLEAGAPVDVQDDHGNTPLWHAVMQFRDFKDMIELLLPFGASPDSKNIYDRSPRDLAMSQRDGAAAEFLDRDVRSSNHP